MVDGMVPVSEIKSAMKMGMWMNRVLVAVAIGFVILAGVLSVAIPYDGMLKWTGLLYISGGVSLLSIVVGFWIRYSLIPSLGLQPTMKGMGVHAIWMSMIAGFHEASGLLWAICSFLYQDPTGLVGTGFHVFLLALMWNAGTDLERFSSQEEAESES